MTEDGVKRLVFIAIFVIISYFLNIELNWLNSYINPHTLKVIPIYTSLLITYFVPNVGLVMILFIELFSYFV